MSSEPREIPPGAVAVAAKALHDEYFAETEIPVRDAESCTLCPIRARKTLEAALSFLASSPEGRAWMLSQVFTSEYLRLLFDVLDRFLSLTPDGVLTEEGLEVERIMSVVRRARDVGGAARG